MQGGMNQMMTTYINRGSHCKCYVQVPRSQNQTLQVPEMETGSGEHYVCVCTYMYKHPCIHTHVHTHAQSCAHMLGPLAV